MDQRFANTTRTILLIIFFTSIVGLITMPLFPWISMEISDSGTYYMSEEYIHVASKPTGSLKEIRNLDGDLGMIWTSFWLSLIFGIIALVGLAIYRAGGRTASIGHILLLIGGVVIVFAILAVVYHGLFIMDVGELDKTYGAGISLSFFYNYIPAIASIILLIASTAYLTIVLPFTGRALFAYRPRYSPQPYPLQPQQQAQAYLKCPACGTAIAANALFCPACGKRIRTYEFEQDNEPSNEKEYYNATLKIDKQSSKEKDDDSKQEDELSTQPSLHRSVVEKYAIVFLIIGAVLGILGLIRLGSIIYWVYTNPPITDMAFEIATQGIRDAGILHIPLLQIALGGILLFVGSVFVAIYTDKTGHDVFCKFLGGCAALFAVICFIMVIYHYIISPIINPPPEPIFGPSYNLRSSVELLRFYVGGLVFIPSLISSVLLLEI